ncbi:hypothetical protein JCM8097_002678 [Rhodosporidiobolus ruineniae]
MSTSNSTSSWSNFSLLGGYPTKKQDLAASILFTVAFSALVPLAVARLARRSSRNSLLYRPAAVILIRIATYIIRAVQAGGDQRVGLYIADQILLLSGLVPLIEPLISLLRYHVLRGFTPSPRSGASAEQRKVTWLDRGLWVLWAASWVSFILGIVSGAEASGAMSDPDKAAKLKRYRYATIALLLLILLLVLVITAVMQFKKRLPLRPTLFLLVCSSILLIPNLYKLIITVRPPPHRGSGPKAGFYLALSLPELLVTLSYFLVPSLDEWFDVREGEWKEKAERKMRWGRWPEELSGYVSREEWEAWEREKKGEKNKEEV